MKRTLTIFLAGLGMCLSGLAHEVPTSVTVRIFVKPQGESLELLVRVPMEAMRDIQFPTREKGLLDLARVEPVLQRAALLWISDDVRLYEGDRLLRDPILRAARVSLPSDPAFAGYETARAHLRDPPLPAQTELRWDQALLDVSFEYSIHSEGSRFSIDPGLQHLGIRVVNVIRFLKGDHVVHALDFPGNPGRIPLDPTRGEVARRFLALGFFHILEGFDHLLFLFCLVIPFRRLRPLVAIITSFTAGHSVTLIASALGRAPDVLWFPPLIEVLIACSILYMAFENIAGVNLTRRWILTLGFGLVHGFGFSFVLRETFQFAGSQLTSSLLAFNLGVELGQLLILTLFIPALELLFRYGVSERLGTILLSALVAHSAWHWILERADTLSRFGWPAPDPSFLPVLLRLLMLIVVVAGALWLWSVLRPALKTSPKEPAASNKAPE